MGTIPLQSQTQGSYLFSCSWQNCIVKCIWGLRWRDRSTSCLPLEQEPGIPNYPLELLTSLPWIYKELLCLYHYQPCHAAWLGACRSFGQVAPTLPSVSLYFRAGGAHHTLMQGSVQSTLSVHSEPMARTVFSFSAESISYKRISLLWIHQHYDIRTLLLVAWDSRRVVIR